MDKAHESTAESGPPERQRWTGAARRWAGALQGWRGTFRPVAFGAALALTVLAAFPLLREAVAPTGDWSSWWVIAPAALAAVLLAAVPLTATRWRRTVAVAGIAAIVAGVLGAVRYATSAPDGEPSLAEALAGDDLRSAAPLAAALSCVVAAGLCLALLRWSKHSWRAAAGRGSPQRQVQRLTAFTLTGVLLGLLLSAGAGVGAERVQQALHESPELVDDISEPAEDTSHTEMPFWEVLARPGIEPDTVAWQDTLAGPAELSSCMLEEPKSDHPRSRRNPEEVPVQSTLVTLAAGDDSDTVIGHNADDGRELWRYTVREADLPESAQGKADGAEWTRIGQVGVSTSGCTVLVLVDPYAVVALDAPTGEVRNVSALPMAGTAEDPWRFSSDSVTEGAPERVVPLHPNSRTYLTSGQGIVGLELGSGTPEAFSTAGPRGCEYLVHHPDRSYSSMDLSPAPDSPLVLVQGCVEPMVFHVDPELDSENFSGAMRALPERDFAELNRVLPHANVGIPRLDCDEPPRVTDLRGSRDTVLVVGEWCEDRYDRPLGLEVPLDLGDFPVPSEEDQDGERLRGGLPLPEGTELPLEPAYPGGDLMLLRGDTLHYHDEWDHYLEESSELYTADAPLAAYVPPVADQLDGATMYALTESGALQTLEFSLSVDHEETWQGYRGGMVATTDIAAGKCAGTRDLLADDIHGRLLVLCRTEGGTEVTAVEEGEDAEDD